jgi:serine/threonine-protein kinase PpkA
MNIPGYSILRELGVGGMATVYLARQERLQREVALKVLELGNGGDQSFTARFIRESRIVARLQHPGIVTIYDFDSQGSYHYFSMEYLPGGTLEDRIEAGLSIEQGLSILAEITDALAYAHGQGIVHRDIKPQNILFRRDGTPVLSDFGIARMGEDHAATKLTRVDAMIGSPRYMSPEQIMGQPLDARSDLYSLGILCYELITGSLPFSAPDVMTLAMKHCTEPLPALPAHLERFQPFLERITAKRPEQRFASAAQVGAALRELLEVAADADATVTDRTRLATRTPQDQPRASPRPIPPTIDAGSARSPPGGAVAPAAAEGTGSAPPQPNARRPRALLGWIAAALVLAVTVAGTAYYLSRQPTPGHAILADLPAAAPDRPGTAANFETLAAEDFAQGRLSRSLELIDLGLEATPDDTRLLALRARIETRRDVEQMYEAATTRAARGDVQGALTLVEEGLQDLPGERRLLRLRDELRADIEGEQRRRALVLADEARGLTADGEHEAALERLDAALRLAPDEADLTTLRARIEATRARERRVGATLEQARRRRADGDLAGALTLVQEGLATDPEDARLSELETELSTEIAAAKAAQREQRIAERLDEARRYRADGDLSGALAAVQQGLRTDPDDTRLTKLQAALSEQIAAEKTADEAARTAAERERKVADALRRGRDLLAQQRFEQGIAVVDGGLDAHPGHPELLSLREQLRVALERQRELGDLLERASALRERQALDEALALIERAAALAPDAAEVVRLREQLAEDRARARAYAERVADCEARLPEVAAPTADEVQHAQRCWLELRQEAPDDAAATAALNTIEERLPDWIALQLERDSPAEARRLAEQLALLNPQAPGLVELRQAIDATELRLSLLPDMIPLEGGCFRMGSPPSEPHREPDERAHRVCVEDFEIGRHEVTVAEFRRFVDATDYRTDAERDAGGLAGCWSLHGSDHTEAGWQHLDAASWRDPLPGMPAAGTEPVSCVSWYDAIAFIDWLNSATGQELRLPTEAEWEYAARAGTQTARYWGDTDGAEACRHANVADAGSDWKDGFACDDGEEWVADVGAFAKNPWGLQDILGNLWEWTCSRYDEDYGGAETRCAKATDDSPRVLRGGSWYSGPQPIRAAGRNRAFPEARYSFLGLRLARDRPATSAARGAD